MMKKRIYPLTIIGAFTIVCNLLAWLALLFNCLVGFFPELYPLSVQNITLSALELLSGTMMFLYLLCSIIIDRDFENKKRALIAWGVSLFTVLGGCVVFSRIITNDHAILFLMIAVCILVIVCVFLNARAISGKGNGILYLLAAILSLIYVLICSFAVIAWDDPLIAGIPALIAAPLLCIYIVLDILYYWSIFQKNDA